MRSLAALKEQMKDFERGRKNWVEPLRAWILDLKQADFLSQSDDLYQIKSFVQKIGTNPSVRDKSPHFGFPPTSQFAAVRRDELSHAAPASRRASALSELEVSICGDGRIRTSDTLSDIPHFECGAFDHSATSPLFLCNHQVSEAGLRAKSIFLLKNLLAIPRAVALRSCEAASLRFSPFRIYRISSAAHSTTLPRLLRATVE